MRYSAQRVRQKARAAVRKREDSVEQDEIESGELNLIPYLDMVTNLMLFLLASVSAGLILVQIDTTLPDKAPASQTTTQPAQDPNEQPLKLVVTITRPEIILWSITGLEGTLKEPHAVFKRTGRLGDVCDGTYMCESNNCENNVCVASRDVPSFVYDYRALNASLFEIANRRYKDKARKPDTYQVFLMADGSTPYGTIVSVMAALRCKLPPLGQEPTTCMLPTEDAELKKAPSPVSPDGKLFDTARAKYDPNQMALFHDILFSTGFE